MRALLRRHKRLLAGPLALIGIAVVTGSVLFMTGTSARGQSNLVSTSAADIAAGRSLFEAHCQSCHGYEGTGGPSAPELVDKGAAAADFYLTTGRMPLNDPGQQPLRHHPYFNPTQIRQLVAYVNALPKITGANVHGPTIPTITPLCPTATPANGCVTLSEGQESFAVNCAQCHQAAGAGGMLSKGFKVPSLFNSTQTQVAEAIRVGPMPMPIFSTQQISDAQASAIAHYVQTLQAKTGPGGFTISSFGPVAEGFVAIVFGFGILLIAVRMIGTRG